MNSILKRFKRHRGFLCTVFQIALISSNAQQSNLVNNTYTPITAATFSNLTVATSTSSVLNPTDDFDNKANIINTNHNDVAKWDYLGILTAQDAFVDVADNNATGKEVYPAGSYAGFVVDASNIGLLSTTTIIVTTFLNNGEQENYTTNVAGLASLSGFNISRVGFKTTKDFNRLQLAFNISGVLDAGTILVYYAEVNKYQAGASLPCNVLTPMSIPEYPVSVQNSFGGQLGLSSINNANSIISPSTTDFAIIDLTASLLGDSVAISVKDNITDYPAGTFVGFEIENNVLLNLDLGGSIILTAYRDGVQQGSPVTGNNLLVGAQLLSDNSRQMIGFVTTEPVDEIKLTLKSGLITLDIGVTKVYNALFKKMCEGPVLTCNLLASINETNYPIYINAQRTRISGLLSVNNSITDAQKAVDGSRASAATVKVLAGAGNSVSLAIKKELSSFARGTFSGFEVSSSSLLSLDLLNNITISTYEDNVLRETFDNSNNALLSINSTILTGSTRQIVGFTAGLSYDEVVISFNNTLAVDLGTVSIYEFYHKIFCPGTIECNKTVWLNAAPPPAGYPTIINTKRTGLSGVACVNCAVSLPDNALSPSASDFATINIGIGALSTGSIAIKDVLSTHPSNAVAGFVIRNTSSLVAADVFGAITISTYNNDTLRETFNGSYLLNLEVLGMPIIGGGDGVYYVGFKTTKTFDEIVISVSSLASVLNTTEVFGAFVDTKFVTNGDGSQPLMCLAPNITPGVVSPLCDGDSVVLTSSVLSGNQWFKNGVAVVGETGITCTIVEPGSYYVTNSNLEYNGASSNTVEVAFNPRRMATTLSIVGGGLPALCNGDSIILTSSVAADVRWLKNGSPVVGGIIGTLNVNETGTYTAIVGNGTCVSDTSNKIVVAAKALAPASITTSVAAPVLCDGDSIILTSSVDTSVQWLKNGLPIIGAITGTLKVGEAGVYAAMIGNGTCVSDTSNKIVVTANALVPASITTSTGASVLCNGDSIILTSSVAVGVQWLKNGLPIIGAITGTLKVGEDGAYAAILGSGTCVSDTSNKIVVTANALVPANITTYVATPVLCNGDSIILTSSVAVGLQWLKNGLPIIGAITGTLKVGEAGVYAAILSSGTCVSDTSNKIIVTANALAPASITTSVAAPVLCNGDSITLTSSVAVGVQWLKNGLPIIGAITGTLKVGEAGVYAAILSSGTCVSDTSNKIVVTANALVPASITTSTGASALCNGDSIILTSSVAVGVQWLKNGLPIIGAITGTLKVGEAGVYAAILSNGTCVSDTSNKIVVAAKALAPASITTSVAAPVLCDGDSIILTSSVDTSVQWLKNGLPIIGAITGTLKVGEAGVYAAMIGNGTCVSDTSNKIVVTANALVPASITTSTGASVLCNGDSIILTSSVAVGVQWLKNGLPIIGAITGTLKVGEDGVYAAILGSGTCVSDTSNKITITTAITLQPATAEVLENKPPIICNAADVVLSSSLESGNQWFKDGVLIPGATAKLYTATVAGAYTVVITSNSCVSIPSNQIVISENNVKPASISLEGSGAPELCIGDAITLTSSVALGNQWLKDGVLLPNATMQNLTVTQPGGYCIIVTADGCSSHPSNIFTINTRTIAPSVISVENGKPPTICIGGSIKLMSDNATGNKWFKNGEIIAGATGQAYIATTPGAYTSMAVNGNCVSPLSNPVSVTIKELIPPIVSITNEVSSILCPGDSIKLASNTLASSQWFKNGVEIAGALASELMVFDTGAYSIKYSIDDCESPASNIIKITSGAAPPIVISVLDGVIPNICNGETVVLVSSSVSGNQWYRNGAKIHGAIDQSYTATEAGIYATINVNTLCPSGFSNEIEITENVIAAPALTVEGNNAIFCEGSSITLKSSSTSGNIWYKNGLMILGVSGQTYTTSEAGVYALKLTKGQCGSGFSNEITAVKNPIPPVSSISLSLGNRFFCPGDSAILTATTSVGNQWYKDGEIIVGATGHVYAAKEKGKYTLIVTLEGCSTLHSNFIDITVFDRPATVVVSLVGANNTICPGQSVTLKSSVPAGNKWYLDGVLIANARDSVFIAKDPGNYNIRTESVAGCIGGLSNVITIEQTNVPAAAEISIVGNNTAICNEQTVTLISSSVYGNSWYRNNVLIASATEQTLTTNQAGVYTVIIATGLCNSNPSNEIVIKTLAKPETPVITARDNKTSICSGEAILLLSGVDGDVQWYKNGNAIPGATTGQLLVSEPGAYSVQAISNCPSDISSEIEVKELVTSTPSITVISGNLNRCPGFGVLFQSSADAGNQWLRNGEPITEATSPQHLSIDSAVYSVIVTQDGCASDASNSIKVTLLESPEPLLITNIEIEMPSNCETDDGVIRIKGNKSNTLYYIEMTRDGKPIFREETSDTDGTIQMKVGNGEYNDISLILGETGCASGPLNHLLSIFGACYDWESDGLFEDVDLDDDNDGITDVLENAQCDTPSDTCDTDGDGIPNRNDLDSDNDGINDVREANGLDGLGDGMADGAISLEPETYGIPLSAGNGLIPIDFDKDGRLNPYDLDADDDGLNDVVENRTPLDENGDGIVDGDDVDRDGIMSSADGLPAIWMDQSDVQLADADEDGIPNYIDLNSDNDPWTDLFETGMDDVLRYDANDDGMIDNKLDNDRDGIVSVLDGAPAVFGDFETPNIPDTGNNNNPPDPYAEPTDTSSGSDLSMSMLILPSITHGVQEVAIFVTVSQLSNSPSVGATTVFMTKDSKVFCTLNPSITELEGIKVNNSYWSIDDTSNDAFIMFTSDAIIKPRGSLSFGLNAVVNSSNAQGVLSITSTILFDGLGDSSVQNNNDAEVLTYFIN